jgi:hypothetical protein
MNFGRAGIPLKNSVICLDSGSNSDVGVDCELTILMPCLNEAETLATCIRKAKDYLRRSGVSGEVLVADNGSTDGSREIAVAEGARIVPVTERGYGAALIGGIKAARGRYVVMGDADDSYDFSKLDPFVNELRGGSALVMGNRFRGGIDPGAMPFLHKYLGNPVLSFVGRLFFASSIKDFHCGLRGFNRDKVRDLDLRTTGMEFASEMVVRAALAGYQISEVPTTLKKDGRSRPPHLRTWRDGWRHLRFLLMYSPKWLFFYPGTFLLIAGILGATLLLPGPVRVGEVGFDTHTFIVSCICILLGLQSVTFALISRRYATNEGFIPPSPRFASLLDSITLEKILLFALMIGLGGTGGVAWCVYTWTSEAFVVSSYPTFLRVLTLSMTAIAAAFSLAFTAFLAGIMDIPRQRR